MTIPAWALISVGVWAYLCVGYLAGVWLTWGNTPARRWRRVLIRIGMLTGWLPAVPALFLWSVLAGIFE